MVACSSCCLFHCLIHSLLSILLCFYHPPQQPIHEVIQRDEETRKIQNIINAGMASNGQNLQNYLSTWDNYREIWEIQKDAFIRRYQKLNPQVSSFDADIGRWVVPHFIALVCWLVWCGSRDWNSSVGSALGLLFCLMQHHGLDPPLSLW